MRFGGLREWLGLERNILAMLCVILLVGMGEELWIRFVPKYLEVLGAGAFVIATYGALKDLLDSIYQYPGGWLADKYGRRFTLLCSCALAIVGYALYLVAPGGMTILIGTVFVMAWSSLTLPAFFAIIGDNLPADLRATGFGVQSFLKRIPIIIAPPIGGWIMTTLGFRAGMHLALVITIALTAAGFWVVRKYYTETSQELSPPLRMRALWKRMDIRLKRLLIADCLARWAEGIPKVFIVLYVLNIVGLEAWMFGWLISIQMFSSIVSYIPVAKLADRLNRKPFVLTTFAFFALFPLMLIRSATLPWIVLAFIVAGLREIGEPARKALIVDLADRDARARSVGLYYLLRGLIVFPASLAGGWLWNIHPSLPFYAAFGVGCAGFAAYAAMNATSTTETQRTQSSK